MMPVPTALTSFDIDNAGLTVWLFKKSGGGAGATPTYTGRWVATSDALDTALKRSIDTARRGIEEVQQYGILAQNNEASALLIDTVETHAPILVEHTSQALPAKKVNKLKDVLNTDFFVVRMTSGDRVLHAVRKTDSTWRTRTRRSVLDLGFIDNTLDLDETPNFSLSQHVDFFIADDQVIIPNKGNFESILSYRQGHLNDFQDLQEEDDFARLFVDLAPLIAFVGNNRIQLRRMSSIRIKGHYRNPDFMSRLRRHHRAFGLALVFDDAGLMVCNVDNCRDVITALLDHRLSSAFSEKVYDVPDATPI